MSSAKDTREFVAALEAVGYEIRRAKTQHLKVYLDGVLVFTLPSTGSDFRWRRNKIAEMRRRGLPLPERTKW